MGNFDFSVLFEVGMLSNHNILPLKCWENQKVSNNFRTIKQNSHYISLSFRWQWKIVIKIIYDTTGPTAKILLSKSLQKFMGFLEKLNYCGFELLIMWLVKTLKFKNKCVTGIFTMISSIVLRPVMLLVLDVHNQGRISDCWFCSRNQKKVISFSQELCSQCFSFYS